EAPTRRADRDALCLCLRSLAGRSLPAAISLRGFQRRRTGSPRLRWRDLPHRRLRAQRRLQFALCAAEWPRLFRSVTVSLSRSRSTRSGDRQDGWDLDETRSGPAPEDLLYQFVGRILGRWTRCGAHPHDARWPRRRQSAGQRPHLSHRRHAARPRRLSAVARAGPAEAERQRIYWGTACAARRHGSLGARRRCAPPSAHPRLADKTLVPRDSIDFPAIPGVRLPLTIPAGYRADLEGPHTAHPLPLLVPQVDRD